MNPGPSKHYEKQQRQLRRLLDIGGGATRNAALSIEEQLEAEFVRDWGLSADIDGVSLRMKMIAAKSRGGFDHWTCYYERETRSEVVVTQPYLEPGEAVELLTRGLSVNGGAQPRIIEASEWAFYYPGEATLIVVKFPTR
jgi:hypothetical protein